MKKIISLVLVAVFAMSMVGCGTKSDTSKPGATESAVATEEAEVEQEELIVGTEAGFAPYEYLGDNNTVVGIDMDIAQAIATAMGRKLVIKNMDFDGALIAVQQGKVDLVAAGVSIDKDRQKVMDFSTEYVNSTEVVVVNKEKTTIATTEDLNDKIIAVQQGNIADFWASNKDNVTPKEVKRYTTFAQAAEDLKNNKVDCIIMDQYPAEELVAANDTLIILQAEGAAAVLFEDKYAIAVKKGNAELLTEINTVIDQLIKDGKIEEFTANHTK